TIEEINEEVLETLPTDEPSEYSLLVFQVVNGQIVNRAGTWRAHFKDCGRQVSAQFVAGQRGTRAFSTRVVNGLYIPNEQYWIPLLRADGTPIAAPDGFHDKPVHFRTPTGQTLSALKRLAYVEPPTLMTFTLLALGESIPETDLHLLF